jgi:DNA-binding beta-propeller fold protein YncE
MPVSKYFEVLSQEEQAAVFSYVRAEYDRVVFQQRPTVISLHAQSNPEQWQDSLRESIASDPGQVRAIMEAVRTKPDSRGFTILELSFVLIIIALVTGMAVSSGISLVSSSRFTATQQKMAAIDKALVQYRAANDRLPCPGDLTLTSSNANYGLEAGSGTGSAIATGTGICTGTGMLQANFTGTGVTTANTAAEGSFPALTLGVPADFMLDGWGNQFRYTVDTIATSNSAFTNIGTSCNSAAVTVKDTNGNARSSASLYALISHGPNGHGAYTKNGVTINAASTNANELINCHCTSAGVTSTSSGAQTTNPATYVQGQPSLDPTSPVNGFDDIVAYKERWQMQTAWDKAGGCSNYLYVIDSINDRIEVFDLKGNFVKTLASGQIGFMGESSALAFDAAGNFWVGDSSNERIAKFDTSGNLLASILTDYTSCGVITGVAVDSTNNVWFSCHYRNRVYKYSSSTGLVLVKLGCTTVGACSAGTGNSQFNNPYGVAVDSSNNVYVADAGNNRVQKFDSNGNFISKFSTSSGTQPMGIKFDAAGNIWVAEYYYVEEYNTGYTLLRTAGAGTSGTGGPLQWYSGFDLALDNSGNIFYADYYYNHIQKVAADGVTFLLQIPCSTGPCSTGSGNGQTNSPSGMAIH